MLRKFALSCVLGIFTFAAGAAQAQDVDAEESIAYRQSLYKLIFWNFGPLAGMARERIPFDRDEFRLRALRVSNFSRQLDEGYAEGTGSGAPTDARPEIWTNREDFDAKMADFQREAHKLYSMSAEADEAALKQQFSVLGGTCKGCHDSYRKD